MPLVKDAENLFMGKLGGRAEIDPIHALFKKGELRDVIWRLMIKGRSWQIGH